MANKTVTVKSSGGTYTSLNAAFVGESADLVTNTCILTIDCYAFEDTTTADTGTGYTTSASYYINVVAHSGEGHVGTFDESKYHLKNLNGYTLTLNIQEDYTRLIGIQLEIADGAYGISDYYANTHCIFNRVIILGGGNGNAFGYGIEAAGGTYINCGVYNIYKGFVAGSWQYPKFYNCTGVGCHYSFGGAPNDHRSIAKNCLSYLSTVSFIDPTLWDQTNSGYNASDDDTVNDLPGSNNQIGVVSTDFVDDNSANFHLAAGATVIDKGVDLSAIFTDDIDGVARGATWDIGADEYVAAGVDVTVDVGLTAGSKTLFSVSENTDQVLSQNLISKGATLFAPSLNTDQVLSQGLISGTKSLFSPSLNTDQVLDQNLITGVKTLFSPSFVLTGWLTGWSYRKSITLSRASGAVNNYQMKLLVGESSGATGEDVDCNSHVQTDFDDLRFTASNGTTLLDYWIESITGTTPNQLATVWIEFDSISTGATTFYMYYGKADALAASNGTNTFLFFDDFLSINPVLTPTQGWETGIFLRWGTIVLVAGIYYIYYTNGALSTSDIGRATSTDLKAWAKATGNPVILDRLGPALLKNLDGVTPITDGGNYYMTTMITDTAIEIRHAATIDSDTWTVDGTVIVPGGTWYSSKVYTNCFIKSGSTFYIFFQGYDGTKWRVGYATADTVTGPYTVQAMLLEPTEAWEGVAIADPEIRLFGSTYYLFYTGNSDTSCKNSYATCATLTGTYVKSGIFLGPLGHSYSAILQKDGLYWILDDNLNTSGQKDLSSRVDLAGAFNLEHYAATLGGWWTLGGSPAVASGTLVVAPAGDSVRSISTHGLDTALRVRGKFTTYINYLQIGYNNDYGAATINQAGFFGYATPTVQAYSTKASSNVGTNLGNQGTGYLIWEIKRTSATPKNVYLIGDSVVATHAVAANVVLTSLPIMVEDYSGAGNVTVDWALIRQILETEPSWGSWGDEVSTAIDVTVDIGLVSVSKTILSPSENTDQVLTQNLVAGSNSLFSISLNTDQTLGLSLMAGVGSLFSSIPQADQVLAQSLLESIGNLLSPSLSTDQTLSVSIELGAGVPYGVTVQAGGDITIDLNLLLAVASMLGISLNTDQILGENLIVSSGSILASSQSAEQILGQNLIAGLSAIYSVLVKIDQTISIIDVLAVLSTLFSVSENTDQVLTQNLVSKFGTLYGVTVTATTVIPSKIVSDASLFRYKHMNLETKVLPEGSFKYKHIKEEN